MTNKFTLLAALWFPYLVFAQTVKPVKPLNNAVAAAVFYTDSIKQNSYALAKQSSYYLSSLLIPSGLNKASLSYTYVKGNFIASQDATSIQAGSFATEGAIQLGKIKLFGGLTYTKTFEDSTRFAHQTRNNTSTPYYFGSPAYVHYERSVYALQTMANRNFLNEKLSIGLGANYKIGDHFASNDPRGNVGEYQLDLMLSAGYQVAGSLKIGAAYKHGYGQERVNVAYKNQRYYESSSFPMYYNHLINGYGEGRPALESANRKYNNNQQKNGVDVYADLSFKQIGNIYLKGTYLNNKQRYFFGYSSGFQEFSTYTLQTSSLDALWLKPIQRGQIGLIVNYKKDAGRDENLTFKANNYLYNANQISTKFLLSLNQGKRNQTTYLTIGQYDEERIDGIKANRVYFKNTTITVGTGLQIKRSNEQFWGVNIATSYTLPTDDSFTVALANEGYFTRYVIYHDYLYHTSSAVLGALQATYGFSIFNSMLATLKADFNYNRQLEEKTLTRTLSSSPGKDRFYSNFSFNLYF